MWNVALASESLVPARPSGLRGMHMKRDDSKTKRTTRSRSTSIDFSRAIQPHRYAKLRTGYKYTVFLEPGLWKHFGSAEAVKAALRDLISASRHIREAG